MSKQKRNRQIGLALVTVANLLVAAFFAFGYVAFTGNMAVESGIGADTPTTYMAYGGLSGGLHRYLFCMAAALLVQSVMLIFNLMVLQFVEPNGHKANRICAYLGLSGFAVMVSISAVLIGLSTH